MTMLPQRLREARRRRDMSQWELADRAGLQPSAISHFENGNREPSIKNLVKLSEALCVTTDHLLALDDRLSGPDAPFVRLENHIANEGAASQLELAALDAWRKGNRSDAEYFLEVQKELANSRPSG